MCKRPSFCGASASLIDMPSGLESVERVTSDVVVPFTIEGRDVRGRIARLDDVVDDIISRHDYPDAVSALLGEALLYAALLGSMMKFEGIFTLQASGDGPVSVIVADYATAAGADGSVSIGGVVRGYARYDEERLAALGDGPYDLGMLMGQGRLVFTLDQGQYAERYQGIVELTGASLDRAMRSYFLNSEQLPSEIIACCVKVSDGEEPRWRAACLLIQHLPSGGKTLDDDAPEDNWQHVRALMQSVTRDELLDPTLTLHDVLFRLFHEDGVRVFAPSHVALGCRCSENRLRLIISSFGEEERRDMAEENVISATCEFCKTEYRFLLSEFN